MQSVISGQFFKRRNYDFLFLWLGQLAVPTSVDYNATLELTNVKMELFRLKRHYNDFTHLQYDCEFGWPYKWVAHIIHIIVWILAILLLVNFTSRFYFKNRDIYDDNV